MPKATQLVSNRRCRASPQRDSLQQILCVALIKLRTNWVQEITLEGYGQMTLETGNREGPVRRTSLVAQFWAWQAWTSLGFQVYMEKKDVIEAGLNSEIKLGHAK